MIKNLVFDFGNVLFFFRPEMHLRAFTNSDEEALTLRNRIYESAPWKAGDRGELSRQESIHALYTMYPGQAKLLRVIMNQCSTWLRMPPAIPVLLQRLKQAGYRLFYISNTNPDDFTHMKKTSPVLREMDGGLASYKEKLLKPDQRIYRLLLQRYQLRADECLFVDDMPVNTEAAQAVGYCVLTLTTGPDTLEQMLRSIPEIDAALSAKKPYCDIARQEKFANE